MGKAPGKLFAQAVTRTGYHSYAVDWIRILSRQPILYYAFYINKQNLDGPDMD